MKEKVRLASVRSRPYFARVNVFTYGSLMFDEVWRRVTGRRGDSCPGNLEGYEAWRIAGETYPGLAPAAGHQVTGRVWLAVRPEELARLDAFEPPIYERLPVQVRVGPDRVLECSTYVIRAEHRGSLLAEKWDPEAFRRRDLATFFDA